MASGEYDSCLLAAAASSAWRGDGSTSAQMTTHLHCCCCCCCYARLVLLLLDYARISASFLYLSCYCLFYLNILLIERKRRKKKEKQRKLSGLVWFGVNAIFIARFRSVRAFFRCRVGVRCRCSVMLHKSSITTYYLITETKTQTHKNLI